MEQKTPLVTPGQKCRHKDTGIIYIVKDIKGNDIILVREDGQGSMLIQMESFVLSGLESIYG
jgi:hypothetical protein